MAPTQDHDGANWGGRLPLLDPNTLREDQGERYDAIVESSVPWAERAGFRAQLEDGRLIGPFNGFLHAPALARGYGRLTRYHLNLAVSENEEFDGVAEVWFESEQAARGVFDTPEGQAARSALDDDVARAVVFVAEEHVIVGN